LTCSRGVASLDSVVAEKVATAKSRFNERRERTNRVAEEAKSKTQGRHATCASASSTIREAHLAFIVIFVVGLVLFLASSLVAFADGFPVQLTVIAGLSGAVA